MATSRIADIRSSLKGGGARPNLFEVSIPAKTGVFEYTGNDSQNEAKILVKAAQLPASNIASIDVPFRGRIMKVAGDRTFDTWTVTVINDVDFALRTSFQNWMQKINQYADSSGEGNPSAYKSDATVTQLRRARGATAGSSDGSAVKENTNGSGLVKAYEYQFFGIFPTNISAIDLSYDTADTIEEFTVEFQVDYWRPEGVADSSDTTNDNQSDGN
jgi:hypothetical protein